jgi:hypothetical protein
LYLRSDICFHELFHSFPSSQIAEVSGEDRSGDSETETDSEREDPPPQQGSRKPFEPGPPLGSNLEVPETPSDLESEGSEDDLDEETPEGRAAVRRRGAREMGDLYRDECLAFCGELLTMQKQWGQVTSSAVRKSSMM